MSNNELVEKIAIFLEERSLAGAAKRVREEFLTKPTFLQEEETYGIGSDGEYCTVDRSGNIKPW